MRVITGSAKGRRLKTPTNYDVRPTTDNVKESIFNIIQFDIEGRTVLDLFAGTGQLGIEALSRGAAKAVFVDKDNNSLKIVKENLDICGLKAQTVKMDSVAFLSNCGRFDIIFIDPPYDSDLYEAALNKINSIDILSDGGIIIVESRRERELPELSAPYFKLREYNYGKIKLTAYTKKGSV